MIYIQSNRQSTLYLPHCVASFSPIRIFTSLSPRTDAKFSGVHLIAGHSCITPWKTTGCWRSCITRSCRYFESGFCLHKDVAMVMHLSMCLWFQKFGYIVLALVCISVLKSSQFVKKFLWSIPTQRNCNVSCENKNQNRTKQTNIEL